jgi:putative Holliday junction resolvase
MRTLGIDWGEKRIGVALSDSNGTIATPYETIDNDSNVVEQLKRLISETGAEHIVLGFPISLSGEDSHASDLMKARLEMLRDQLPIELELIDERLTTVSAHKQLAEAGLSEKKRRNKVDEMAATIILQAWLDSHAS